LGTTRDGYEALSDVFDRPRCQYFRDGAPIDQLIGAVDLTRIGIPVALLVVRVFAERRLRSRRHARNTQGLIP
jgi:hypothetical protein